METHELRVCGFVVWFYHRFLIGNGKATPIIIAEIPAGILSQSREIFWVSISSTTSTSSN